MLASVEIQSISKLLLSENDEEVETLLGFDTSYYSIYENQIEFILNHHARYGNVPDVFTFQAQFPDIELVRVDETVEYLVRGLKRNKQRIILLETFNKINDLDSDDVSDAWKYIGMQYDKAVDLEESNPMNIVKQAKERSDEVREFSVKSRIPTGFPEIDKIMYGGLSTVEELVVIIARTNSGKAQPLWSKVLTPYGWKTMGEIQVGDIVVGKNNDNGRVVEIFPQGVKDYYRVHFNDGTYVECCDDHLWEVIKDGVFGSQTVTTKQIRESNCDSYYIPISKALEYQDSCGNLNDRASDFSALLNSLQDNQHPYDDYMYFLYTDDEVNKFTDLARSLGYFSCAYSDLDRDSKPCYSVEYRLCNYKKIESVEYIGKTECQCILLDNESHTYITDNYTVTHNTWVTTKMMETAQKNGFPVLFYSPEMQASLLATRFDTWRGHFKNSELYRGVYSNDYNDYIDRLSQEETPAIILEDKDLGGSVSVKSLTPIIKRYGIKLLIIDGLSYMDDDQKHSREYDKYKHIAADLFNLSKQYGCAVVLSMQANRGTRESLDNQGEPFPTIYNAEGSDHPCRIATQVFAIRQIFETHTLDIRLEKSRTAANTKPVLSYSWEVNTGHVQYIESADNPLNAQAPVSPSISVSSTSDNMSAGESLLAGLEDDDDYGNVVF